MPVSITKKNGGYQVRTPGGVKAKHTAKKKAEAQARLLHGVDHGWKPTGKKAKESVERHADSLLHKLTEMDRRDPPKTMECEGCGNPVKVGEDLNGYCSTCCDKFEAQEKGKRKSKSTEESIDFQACELLSRLLMTRDR